MRISDWSSDVCSSDLTTFEQTTTGFQVNVGVPLTAFLSAFGRYSLNYDDVLLDKRIYYFGNDCDPLVAGRYMCAAISTRTTSLVCLDQKSVVLGTSGSVRVDRGGRRSIPNKKHNKQPTNN